MAEFRCENWRCHILNLCNKSRKCGDLMPFQFCNVFLEMRSDARGPYVTESLESVALGVSGTHFREAASRARLEGPVKTDPTMFD